MNLKKRNKRKSYKKNRHYNLKNKSIKRKRKIKKKNIKYDFKGGFFSNPFKRKKGNKNLEITEEENTEKNKTELLKTIEDENYRYTLELKDNKLIVNKKLKTEKASARKTEDEIFELEENKNKLEMARSKTNDNEIKNTIDKEIKKLDLKISVLSDKLNDPNELFDERLSNIEKNIEMLLENKNNEMSSAQVTDYELLKTINRILLKNNVNRNPVKLKSMPHLYDFDGGILNYKKGSLAEFFHSIPKYGKEDKKKDDKKDEDVKEIKKMIIEEEEDKKRLDKENRKKLQEENARKIQALIRKKQEEKRLEEKRLEEKRQEEAAKKIQTLFRKRKKEEKDDKGEQEENIQEGKKQEENIQEKIIDKEVEQLKTNVEKKMSENIDETFSNIPLAKALTAKSSDDTISKIKQAKKSGDEKRKKAKTKKAETKKAETKKAETGKKGGGKRKSMKNRRKGKKSKNKSLKKRRKRKGNK